MIKIQWLNCKKHTKKTEFKDLEEFNAELKEKDIEEVSFKPYVDLLLKGDLVYVSINPYDIEVEEIKTLIMSSNKEKLISKYEAMADDI